MLALQCPSPGDAQSRQFAQRLQWGCVLPENLGSWLKSLEEADIPFFSLGNQIKVREQQEMQEFMQTSHGELGKLPSLIKLKNYIEKRCFLLKL